MSAVRSGANLIISCLNSAKTSLAIFVIPLDLSDVKKYIINLGQSDKNETNLKFNFIGQVNSSHYSRNFVENTSYLILHDLRDPNDFSDTNSSLN